MKLHCLVLLCFITNFSLFFSQPTLNSDEYDLVIGKSKKFDFPYDIDTFVTGENVVWVFSEIDLNYISTTLVEAPSVPALGENFMDSDFATENEISDGRIFFSLDPDGLYFDGSQNDILLLTTCLDPLQQINFLLTYKSSFEDSWKCQFTSFGVPTTNEGVVQGFLDGFGTLILPSGIN